jgi:phosphomannomutase
MATATTAYRFDPTVLREYDIRGIIGKTLTEEDALAIGRSFGSILRRRGAEHVCVGYDGRHSSPFLEAALVEGLVSTGLVVHRIGMGPTPMLYFSVKYLNTAGGVMITGSHNPPEYNGFKMLTNSGPVFGDQIQEIGTVSAAGDHVFGMGSSEQVNVSTAYLEKLLKAVKMPRPLKVVWDNGNGAGGYILRRLVEKMPGEHVLLFDDVDGNFPNHHPDPTVPKNLVDLQKAVADHKADLGVAFDGDADRVGAIDGHGNILFGDQLLAVFAAEVLKEHPGGTIIADVKASQVLFDEITRLGGKPLMWKTGHSLLKAKMAEVNSPLAGEMSGHIFFQENYGFDDALFAAIKLISIVSQSSGSLTDLTAHFPQTSSTPESRFQVDEARKFAVIDEVKSRLLGQDGIKVNDLDGVRVNTADGWWLLRASNTQDVLVARAESTTSEGLARLCAMLKTQLAASAIIAPDEF